MSALADRYYTPVDVAERLAMAFRCFDVSVVIDPACGDGRLLAAAAKVFPAASLLGIDVDRSAIRKLRLRQPSWIVSNANMLSQQSRRRSVVGSTDLKCDLVVANPPFSMGPSKGCFFEYGGGVFRASLAMRYLLESVFFFRPSVGFAAVLPESSAYSVMDAEARACLDQFYSWAVVERLPRTAFAGTRARSILVIGWNKGRIGPRLARTSLAKRKTIGHEKLVRGGLPMHEAREWKFGIPFLHTTALVPLGAGGAGFLPQVFPIGRGIVMGPAVAFPRIGEIGKGQVVVIPAGLRVQLSDCVMAVRADTASDAARIRKTILSRWDGFAALFKGTGARYVTVDRMVAWLDEQVLLG
ncbi:N-6 DNA methylase [Corallococcus silvisoli]|uniref:N-6 DNA methylase n=1 Tax=Corallococcus silvisoli TaxID=2697031 RepID=UPI0013775BFF|nr:N-6 DNA methylase [Corallococcus silvisoli]NBD08026.1 methyltransferase [Corallococcus silvisoli]